MIQSSSENKPSHTAARPAGYILLRDKYVQILVSTAEPPAAEGNI